MNTSFSSRLPAGHEVFKYNKVTARRMLDYDSRAVISLDNLTVASLREYCAAILWLNDSSPVLLSDSESLSPNERCALCRLLGLVEAGVQAAVSRRILASQFIISSLSAATSRTASARRSINNLIAASTTG